MLSSISTYSFGQISYEKGYFIDNDNRETKCLIKDSDWRNNPTEFINKLEDSGLPEKGNIASVKEFGIYGFSKFIRGNVKIDSSSNNTNKLSNKMNPIWSQEKLFLKNILTVMVALWIFLNKMVKAISEFINSPSIQAPTSKKSDKQHSILSLKSFLN